MITSEKNLNPNIARTGNQSFWRICPEFLRSITGSEREAKQKREATRKERDKTLKSIGWMAVE